MPLKVIKPPTVVAEVVRGHLGQMSAVGRFRTERLRSAAPTALSLAVPHPVYILGLSDIKGLNPLAKAKLKAWRYLVLEGTDVIATAEAVQQTASAKPVFSQTSEGPFVASTAAAIEAAEQIPEVKAGQFELAVLQVPALYMVALWLRGSAKAKNDIFIPLEPVPRGIKAATRMTAAEFGAALLALKAERGKTTSTSS